MAIDFLTNASADPYGYAGPQTGIDASMNAGGFMGGVGNAMSKNPEMFAIMLDMLGQGFDKDNPFAGFGTTMGKSSLANKALAEEKTEQQDWRKLIAGMVSGEVPVTAPGEAGLSKATINPNKDCKSSEINLSLTEPTDKTKAEAKPSSLNLGDLMRSPF